MQRVAAQAQGRAEGRPRARRTTHRRGGVALHEAVDGGGALVHAPRLGGGDGGASVIRVLCVVEHGLGLGLGGPRGLRARVFREGARGCWLRCMRCNRRWQSARGQRSRRRGDHAAARVALVSPGSTEPHSKAVQASLVEEPLGGNSPVQRRWRQALASSLVG